jgi:hypothetical protein
LQSKKFDIDIRKYIWDMAWCLRKAFENKLYFLS